MTGKISREAKSCFVSRSTGGIFDIWLFRYWINFDILSSPLSYGKVLTDFALSWMWSHRNPFFAMPSSSNTSKRFAFTKELPTGTLFSSGEYRAAASPSGCTRLLGFLSRSWMDEHGIQEFVLNRFLNKHFFDSSPLIKQPSMTKQTTYNQKGQNI